MKTFFKRTVKRVSALALLLLWALPIIGQDITGVWSGDISVNGVKLKFVFRIDKNEAGYVALLDIPDQGAKGIPVSSVVLDGSDLSVDIRNLGAIYKGIVTNNVSIEGTFSQSGMSFPLLLTKGEPEALKRPQEPKPPYPYKSEEVSFSNEKAEAVFAGTITIPEGKGPFPAVIIVSGSGAQNRDGEMLGHKPYLLIGDYLTRNGIAVLRYDDRGFGKSTGDANIGTSEDFMEDALCAFEYLSQRSDVDRKKIGIIGHSEGGNIAFMAAARNKNIAFIVSMAGMAASGDVILGKQNYDLLIASGVSEEVASAYHNALKEIYSVINARSHSDIVANIAKIEAELFKDKREMLPEHLSQNLSLSLRGISANPWLRFFVGYNPKENIIAGSCPILALFGEKDLQVNARDNYSLLVEYLKQGKSADHSVQIYPNLNHLFQNCKTGEVEEYKDIEETMSEEVLEDIKNWILKKVAEIKR
jgi:Dienelactone hydrolase and related enzymes